MQAKTPNYTTKGGTMFTHKLLIGEKVLHYCTEHEDGSITLDNGRTFRDAHALLRFFGDNAWYDYI